MEKIVIKNRKNQNIVVLVENIPNQKGLAFVMHGLGESKDSEQIKTFSRSFADNNYTVVRFDTTNTFGESDGNFEDATLTGYYEDLEDVIAWSKRQEWYQEPFILCGHSLGSICSALYAENFPKEVKALAPLSTVINIKLSKEIYTEEELKKWKKLGWLAEDWGGTEVKIKWSYMEDKEKYDLLKKVDRLSMPTLLIVGEFDSCALPAHQKILFDRLPGQRELHIIKGSRHVFKTPEQLEEVYQIINKWIKNLLV